MNTIDFIRHHTRLILREKAGEQPTPAEPPAEPAADFRGKYSKAVRGGRASNAARKAEGLARSDPQKLLSNLGMKGYTTTGSSKVDEVFNFLKKFRGATPQIAVAFEQPESKGASIDFPISSLTKTESAISQFQAARYVRSVLIAGFITGLIDFDPMKPGNKVQTRSVEAGDEKKYFVRVTIPGE